MSSCLRYSLCCAIFAKFTAISEGRLPISLNKVNLSVEEVRYKQGLQTNKLRCREIFTIPTNTMTRSMSTGLFVLIFLLIALIPLPCHLFHLNWGSKLLLCENRSTIFEFDFQSFLLFNECQPFHISVITILQLLVIKVLNMCKRQTPMGWELNNDIVSG